MKTEDHNCLYIPVEVRHCPNLQPNAKLLFGEIVSRANEKGEAIFQYDEIPEMFNVKKKAVYYWVDALERKGFIISKILRRRRIHYQAFKILLKLP